MNSHDYPRSRLTSQNSMNNSDYQGEPSSSHRDGQEDEDEEVAESDPTNRYNRYEQEVGHGRFKQVYKGFDMQQGIDVAWSKIQQGQNNLDEEQMHRIVQEMSIGLKLDHPNIIKCFRCWEDPSDHSINLITEFFTSGNLRDYRQRHKHLDFKAVRKWARQILLGLEHLHSREVPIIHGDLRCDKIYINGHSGEIKIGDLGLATLLPRRFEPGVLPNGSGTKNQYTQEVDIFAFGLCVLEMATVQKMDSESAHLWQGVLQLVKDEEAKKFIERCLSPEVQRPTASELLEDSFVARRPMAGDSSKSLRKNEGDASGLGLGVGRGDSLSAERDRGADAVDTSGDSRGSISCAVGTVRGEDYNFEFRGWIRDGKLHFRLRMEYMANEGSEPEGDGDADDDAKTTRTIDFTYDPETDTPDEIATEIGNEFSLSSTDKDICAAALKEWLAKELESKP